MAELTIVHVVKDPPSGIGRFNANPKSARARMVRPSNPATQQTVRAVRPVEVQSDVLVVEEFDSLFGRGRPHDLHG